MGFFELMLVAVGVSMDAFAVAVCKGLGMRTVNLRTTAELALSFGGFQTLMPLVGGVLGSQFLWLIAPVDHWIAFGLLGCIGAKMIWDAVHETEGCGCENTSHVSLREILVLSVATSIDALAVGISFAVLAVDIVPAVVTIGLTTFAFSLAGVAVGHFFGACFERPANVVGGVVLILIGFKILLEHLGVLAF